MALAALTLGKRTPQQAISDPGYYWFGNHKFRDDKEGGHGYVDMYRSIVQSCDTYYYMLANDLGVDTMHDFMKPFGFGQGYNSFTPLQIAHAVANLANNGVVMKPHLVKIVEDGATRARTQTVPKESYRINLKQQNIDVIKQAMIGVTK